MSCPTQCILGQNITFTVQAKSGTGAPADATGDVSYSIYEDETGTAILTGTMAKLAAQTGFYSEQIACTADNGFEQYKTYTIRISATVVAVAVAVAYSFIALGAEDLPTATTGALTTTANFKTFAGITSTDDDALIGSLITRATSAREAFCGRTLTSKTYRDRYSGDGTNELILDQYPVTEIQMLSIGYVNVLRINNNTSDAYNAYIFVEDSTLTAPTMDLVLQGGTSAGTNTINLATGNGGGEHTISTLNTAINALGSGWSSTSLLSEFDSWSAIELKPLGGLQCFDNSYAYLECPNEPEADYNYDRGRGTVYLKSKFHRGTDNITIRYTAGYTVTPADLEQICIDYVNIIYRSSKKDILLKSEKLGDHTISYFERADYMTLPSEIAKRLAPYKRWRLTI